jgi:hypothetical protein
LRKTEVLFNGPSILTQNKKLTTHLESVNPALKSSKIETGGLQNLKAASFKMERLFCLKNIKNIEHRGPISNSAHSNISVYPIPFTGSINPELKDQLPA